MHDDEPVSRQIPSEAARTTGWSSALWAVAVIVGAVLADQHWVNHHRHQVRHETANRLQALGQQLEDRLGQWALSSRLLADQGENLADLPAPRWTALAGELQVRQALLLTPQGRPLAGTSTTRRNWQDQPLLLKALEHGVAFEHTVHPGSASPALLFAARVPQQGDARAVLILEADPTRLTPVFADAAQGQNVLILTDSNGVIVAGNRPAIQGRLAPVGATPLSHDRELVSHYGRVPPRLDWAGAVVDIEGQPVRTLRLDEGEHLALSRPLSQYPYTVWALASLQGETAVHALSASTALALGLTGHLILSGWQRRRQHSALVSQAREDALSMNGLFPLTAFRYVQPAQGPGRFAFVGPGASSIFGLDDEALQQDATRVWQMIQPGQTQPLTHPQESWIKTPGGSRCVRTASIVSAGDQDEQVFDGYWMDVTAQRQAEHRLDTVFDHCGSALLVVHRRQGVVRSNAPALTLLGAVTAEQLQGRTPWQEPLPAGDGLVRQDQALTRLDGSRFQAWLSLVPLPGQDPDLLLVVIEDITARQQTEQALRQAQEAARHTDRAKSAFLSNMSHEIRTPMNAIIGMTHLAMQDPQSDKLRSYVAKTHQAARSLLQIVNDILDLAKIESDQLALECVEFPLQGVIDQLSDVLGLQAESKGLELLFAASADLPSHLLGDPTRLRQVMLNLGANAIKFTDHGSVTLGLEVQSRHGVAVELHGWVRDTGIGISQADQARLFQPFSQGDSSTTRRFGGAGLGLTICQHLLERMGGQLWVDSTPGHGSTFHFTVKTHVPSGPVQVPEVRDDWRGRRVLLADDNPDARHVLGEMLTGLGLVVDVVHSGAAALERLNEAAQPYDWILLDWKMPGMDGIDCAAAIQQLARRASSSVDPCILLVTAFNKEDALEAAGDVRLAGVLTKPVTPAALAECLRRTHTVRSLVRPPDDAVAEAPDPALLAGTRILLVEDHPLNQELARDLLDLAGATVVCADNGALALTALARQGPFDCVLMDCQMPVMDGYTATRKIRQQPQWQQLPILAMTASALASDREHALASGMNDHIAKPLDVAQMYRVVAQWVAAGQALRREAQVRTDTGTTA